MPSNRKSPRLPTAHYLGQKSHFITICCDRRVPHLQNPKTAHHVLTALLDAATKRSFLLHAYCAMPDHLHFLAQGTNERSNLLELLKLFKSRTSYVFKKQHNLRLWELSFYDHILRHSDPIENVAAYILQNPLRAHLCANAAEYPYSGSQTIDWIQKSCSSSPSTWQPPTLRM